NRAAVILTAIVSMVNRTDGSALPAVYAALRQRLQGLSDLGWWRAVCRRFALGRLGWRRGGLRGSHLRGFPLDRTGSRVCFREECGSRLGVERPVRGFLPYGPGLLRRPVRGAEA